MFWRRPEPSVPRWAHEHMIAALQAQVDHWREHAVRLSDALERRERHKLGLNELKNPHPVDVVLKNGARGKPQTGLSPRIMEAVRAWESPEIQQERLHRALALVEESYTEREILEMLDEAVDPLANPQEA